MVSRPEPTPLFVFVVLQCKFKKGDKRDWAGDKERKSPYPPCLCSAYTSGATYTQFPDSCALRFVFRGRCLKQFPVATGGVGGVAARVYQKRTTEK
jgi:hypothetical protein